MIAASELKWQPLELLDRRFRSNLAALATRDPQLAQRLGDVAISVPFFVAANGDDIYLGRPGPAGMEIVPNALPPAAARNLAGGLFPSGNVAYPVVVGGLAYGWLWDRLSKLPCKVETAPGHRPPVYFLTRNIERLWAVLHVLDWQQMLADERFVFLVGPNAVSELRDLLVQNPLLPRPKVAVRIEQELWKEDFDTLTKTVALQTEQKVCELATQLRATYPPIAPAVLAEKLRSGRLRILGITSRYTTFLQYSMRDWLAAFERLGHETRLLIETSDHVVFGPYGFARGVLDYRPDLIVMIDHYRAEIGPIPDTIPTVMWVQDRLPNIFSPQAGQNQKPNDYCIGMGRLHLSSRFGYPAERFMSCPVGINEERLARVASEADLARYRCDVSYVCHASAPADRIVKEYAQRSGSPQIARLCDDMHQRLEAWYAGGGDAICDVILRGMLDESMKTTGVELRPTDVSEFLVFLSHRVNNAIFRHQTLHWLATMDINLHLWGRGWEDHPTLKRFARGEANNQSELPLIYQASRINLQVTPFGSMHQRLLDGLAAGGFFLMRYHPADEMGIAYRALWEWCQRKGITDDAQMYARADAEAQKWIGQINSLLGYDPALRDMPLFDCLQTLSDQDFGTLANANWPEEYPMVAFKNEPGLREKVSHYLSNEAKRMRIARSMRDAVIERWSYRSISQRLLQFMSEATEARSRREAVTARIAA
ncbi:MAG TPA: glycosyltransferase [Tepidisphaeraceae bacterium]|nr:glycosyltransferase [Tepidisphaeraceae bacterium]